MKIGLLVCDQPRVELNHPDGSYPEMFRRILPGFEFRDFMVCEGIFPESAHACDGWIISGSRLSVYDQADWIDRLKDFTREVAGSGKPCIGVCFGHQMVGSALGGEVIKAETGWCVGVHPFKMEVAESWMTPKLDRANLLMMCQDQVVKLPPKAIRIASSPMCPNAIFRVGENILGIQGHPEFSVSFEMGLIHLNGQFLVPGQEEEGIESLSQVVHSEVVAGWMGRWLMGGMGQKGGTKRGL